jgi:hypothetical protein
MGANNSKLEEHNDHQPNLNNEPVSNPDTTITFKLDEIPLGTCVECKYKQTEPGANGIWLCGLKDRWICWDCKYKHGYRSRPFACEWCTYEDVKWFQGPTYDCPRCKFFEIGQDYKPVDIKEPEQ